MYVRTTPKAVCILLYLFCKKIQLTQSPIVSFSLSTPCTWDLQETMYNKKYKYTTLLQHLLSP